LGAADAVKADDVRGRVPRGDGEDADVVVRVQFLRRVTIDAVGPGRPFGEDLGAIRQQHPRAVQGLAGPHVLGIP